MTPGLEGSEKPGGKKLAPRTVRTRTLRNKRQPDIVVIQWDFNKTNAKFVYSNSMEVFKVTGYSYLSLHFWWTFSMKLYTQLGSPGSPGSPCRNEAESGRGRAKTGDGSFDTASYFKDHPTEIGRG